MNRIVTITIILMPSTKKVKKTARHVFLSAGMQKISNGSMIPSPRLQSADMSHTNLGRRSGVNVPVRGRGGSGAMDEIIPRGIGGNVF